MLPCKHFETCLPDKARSFIHPKRLEEQGSIDEADFSVIHALLLVTVRFIVLLAARVCTQFGEVLSFIHGMHSSDLLGRWL